MKDLWSVLAIVVISATVLAGGCRREDPSPPGKNSPPSNVASGPVTGAGPGAAPRIAARNMFRLLFEGSREQFLACFTGTDEENRVIGVMFDFTRSSADFRDLFIKTYGKAAWETGKSSDAQDKDIVLKDIALAQVMVDGDKAMLVNTNPGSTQQNPLLLVKVREVWMVKASSLQPTGDGAVKVVQTMRTMASIMTRYRKAIGKPGIRPEDIKIELRRAFEEQVGGKTDPVPHRFEIDKIK